MRLFTSETAILLLIQLSASSAQIPAGDSFDYFVTEPTFRSNRLVVKFLSDKSLVEPGYIFFAPFPAPQNPLNGPQIIDQNGQLIWYGNATSKVRAQDFHACRYLEDIPTHLCWSESQGTTGLQHVRGSNRIFDNTYTQVGRDYVSSPPLRFPDPHEFNTLPKGNSFLQSVYQLKPADLTSYGGIHDGYIYDGCFQEVDVLTGDSLFSWCGLDHLALWHSYVYFEKATNDTGEHFGKGTVRSPWDYFHLNAVDKNEEGDYFVSARHLDQIIKIAGNNNTHGVAPGTILWRLGGKLNDFENADSIDLSRQHHVRHLRTTANETTISLFNNQWLQKDGSHGISNAQVIVINNQTMSVTNVRKYHNPDGYLSAAQGSAQVLPNENVLVNWGFVPHVSEFSRDGTLLYHAHLANFSTDPGSMGQVNYRGFKFNWTGKPYWNPKLVVYSRGCVSNQEGPMIAYVSWNGATEVRFWRFYTSQTSKRGPWLRAGTFERTGFETKAYLKDMFGRSASFSRFVSMEALDARYNVLSTVTVETFVPDEKISESCEGDGCFASDGFEYGSELNIARTCSSSTDACIPIIALILVCCVLEYIIFLKRKFLLSLITGRKWRSSGYIRIGLEAGNTEKA